MKRLSLLRYRYYPRRYQSTKGDRGYLARRLQDLKEQNDPNPHDPLVQLTKGKSLVDEDPELQNVHQKLSQKAFEEKYRSQIQYARIQDHVNQQSKDIALSKPWMGEEAIEDTSLRMILDSVGKPQGSTSSVSAILGFTKPVQSIDESRAIRASKKLRRKLEDAQDKVLKYERDKEKELDNNEQSEFRTLYAEKFTPIGSFEKLRSLADRRIEESIKQGGFDDLKHLRGKRSPTVQPNQHVDRTEHHLNNMLVRQKISPPWIENQGRVNNDVLTFRREAANMFENDVMSYLGTAGLLRTKPTLASVESAIDTKFGSTEKFLSSRFAHWKGLHRSHFENKIKSINNSLRTYNLQAPLSTQKLYLLPEKELERAYSSIDLKKLVVKELEDMSKRETSLPTGQTNGRLFIFPKISKFW